MSRKRKQRSRGQERARMLVVCEGTVTEPTYFRCLKQRHGLTDVHVDRRKSTARSDPNSVVQRALNLVNDAKGKGIEYPPSSVWCVFDGDHRPLTEMENAFANAEEHGFNVAFSNPCFEFWLLLHFEYTDAWLTPDQCQNRLQAHMPNYTKTMLNLYSTLNKYPHANQTEAIARATQLVEYHCNPQGVACINATPYTTIHLLIAALLRRVR